MDVPEPTQRVGHSFTALPDGRFLFFGGWDGSKLTNDAYFYTPATGQWAQIMPGPEESHVMAPQADTIFWPQPLAWHTANLVVDDERHWRLVVFGGKDATDVTGNALELKIKILSDKEVALMRVPSEGKTAVEKYLDKQKEINHTRKEFSPLVPKLSWSKIDFAHQKSPYYQHPTSRPADRMQHTGTSHDRNKIVYLGGQGRSGRRLGDMWELNTKSWRWRQIRIRGWPPSSGHSSVLISPGVLLVFGGETAQDTPAEPELWHIRCHFQPPLPKCFSIRYPKNLDSYTHACTRNRRTHKAHKTTDPHPEEERGMISQNVGIPESLHAQNQVWKVPRGPDRGCGACTARGREAVWRHAGGGRSGGGHRAR
jgi:hypothetical protein